MKKIIIFLFIIIGGISAHSQSYLKTKASGFAKFTKVEDIEWTNDRGQVALYKDKVTYCNKDEACLEVKVYGKIKMEETKFKGKKYTTYNQLGTNEQGEAVEVRKYIAKNHDKYYDLLWIHSEQKEDIIIECSTLMKGRTK